MSDVLSNLERGSRYAFFIGGFILIFALFDLGYHIDGHGSKTGVGLDILDVTCVQVSEGEWPRVPAVHPQITISHADFPFNHWFEIVVNHGSSTSTHLISFSTPYTGSDILDGFLGDIRGGDWYVLNPFADYTLRVWRHEYEPIPQFEESELVFESSFTIPVCQ